MNIMGIEEINSIIFIAIPKQFYNCYNHQSFK